MIEEDEVTEANDRLSHQRMKHPAKVRDLIDFSECDVSLTSTDATVTSPLKPVDDLCMDLSTLADSRDTGDGDDASWTSRTRTSQASSHPSLTTPMSLASESEHVREIELLQQRLRDAEEQMLIQAAIGKDHLSEKEKQIAELEQRCADAEVALSRGRGDCTEPGSQSTPSATLPEHFADMHLQVHSSLRPLSATFWFLCARGVRAALSHVDTLRQMTRVS